MHTRCPQESVTEALLRGTLESSRIDSAANHLQSCSACQKQLASLKTIPWGNPHGAGHDSATWRNCAELTRLMASQAIKADNPSAATPESLLGALAGWMSPPEAGDTGVGRIPGYELLSLIGSGGMGIVYCARDLRLHRTVALKILASHLIHKPSARERFLREARAVAAVEHDHVVRIYGVEEHKGLPFLVMEYVAGKNLAEQIHESGPLPVSAVIRIGRQIAAGLAAAHSQGVIHRDLKPANVLLTTDTQVAKLVDFGLASLADEPGLTGSGFLAGTIEFTAPERLLDSPMDSRSDLFSLGCCLYVLLTGISPFNGTSSGASIRKLLDHHPPLVTRHRADCPEWLAQTVDRLLTKRPSDRLGSAEELARILERERFPASPEAASRRQRFGPWIWGMAAVAATLLLLLAAWPRFARIRETDPFHVQDAAGHTIASEADLATAQILAPPGGAVLFRWQGPRSFRPIRLASRPLAIRAAPGYQPVWVHEDLQMPALEATADLRLEGIEFSAQSTNREPQPSPSGFRRPARHVPPTSGALIRATGGTLVLQACRFTRSIPDVDTSLGFSCVLLEGGAQGEFIDTLLFAAPGKGIVWRLPRTAPSDPSASVARLQLSNCLSFATETVHLEHGASSPAFLSLRQSSFKGKTVLYLSTNHVDGSLRILAESNLFNSGSLIVDFRPAAKSPHDLAALEWIGRGNFFSFNRTWMEGPSRGPRSLEDWRSWPAVSELGSARGMVRFAGRREVASPGERTSPSLNDFEVTEALVEEGLKQFEAGSPAIGARLHQLGGDPLKSPGP